MFNGVALNNNSNGLELKSIANQLTVFGLQTRIGDKLVINCYFCHLFVYKR